MERIVTNTELLHAFNLGRRDAQRGHAESHPIFPFTSAELEAYRNGYKDGRRAAEAHRAMSYVTDVLLRA